VLFRSVSATAGPSVTTGQVVHADSSGIQVACGDGILNITRLQLAGRNAMSAAEFLNAHSLANQLLG